MKRVISGLGLAVVLVVAGLAAAHLVAQQTGATTDKTNSSSSRVHFYSSDQVKKTFARDPSVPADGVTNGRAGVLLNARDNPGFQVTIRRHDEADTPEIHRDHAHVFYVLEGAATFVTGGKVVGKTIEGGDTWDLSAGSIIVVPIGVPHWFKEVTKDPWIAFGVEVH